MADLIPGFQRMRYLAILGALLGIAAFATPGSDDKPVRDVENLLDLSVGNARIEYNKTAMQARQKYVLRLKALQERVLRSGDLDRAVMVREKIRNAQSEITAISRELMDANDNEFRVAFARQIWASTNGGWGGHFRFAFDGSVVSEPGSRKIGTWALLDDNRVVSITTGQVVDEFRVDLKRGLLEARGIGAIGKPKATWNAMCIQEE